jgi:hypothetical protein
LSLSVTIGFGYGSEADPTPVQAVEAFPFTNATDSSRFVSLANFGGHGVQLADTNGDLLIDIYVTNIFEPKGNRPDLLFVNNGDWTFEEKAAEAGVRDDGFHGERSEESHAAVFADLDNDGDYDLFNAHTWTGHNLLYRNDGTGRFVDMSESAGIEVTPLLESRGVTAGDVNGDGLVDIVLSAWENQQVLLYRNLGGLHFETVNDFGNEGALLANQGIMLTDFDRDSDIDLATTGYELATLPIGPIAIYKNSNQGQFREAVRESRIRYQNGGTNGWSFGDVDNDGDLDALVVGVFQALPQQRGRNVRTGARIQPGQLHRRPGGFRSRWRLGHLFRWKP